MATIKYLLAHETDFQLGIVTKTVGQQYIEASSPYPPVGHPKDHLFSPEGGRILQDTHILYIIKGSGWFTSSHQATTHISAGDAIILFPGEWHSYAPDPRTGWTEAWVGFTGEFAEKMLARYGFDVSNPIYNVGVSNKLCIAFEHAYDVAEKQLPAYQQQLAGYIGLIISIIYAKRQQRPYQNNPNMNHINLAMKFMRQNLYHNISMEDVAVEVGMGYTRFRKVFKECTGFPPNQYFLRLKMERAKECLLGSALSCKEIAFELGFDSESYFVKVFRAHEGLSPLAFRKAHTFT
ncbi:MAG: helix-turn-helix domain-containing protein [Bacteroidaceae bacterium]|nr:helix-turn-helix domain-containing protein [Bacteroidaceae bacterium]